MVGRLHKIVDTTERELASPEQLSRTTAQKDRSQVPYREVEREVREARKLLHSGYTQAAIDQLEHLQARMENDEISAYESTQMALRELLAVSYLRRGQEENCFDGRPVSSCLFPIKQSEAFSQQENSSAAIELYTDVLQRRPWDLEARWLLNLAYMTVGEYPDGVPDSLVIAAESFASEYDVPEFPEVASAAGVAEMGLSGGSVLEDFDGDGHLDIMASSWGLEDQLRYYRNNGDGTFEDRTIEAGLQGLYGGLNLVHGDFNNDGAPDVFVLRGAWHGEEGRHPNSLLRNNGDGTFSDVTEEAGVLSFHPTQTATWGDFNNDGWLDLFIGNETSSESRHTCELYVNNTDGTFTNVAEEVGLNVHGFVKGVASGDFNNDGRLDVYLSRLGEPNLLFRNDGAGPSGQWQFTEVSEDAGVQEPLNSFPTWFWDYNNDGRLDLFVSGFGAGYEVDVANVASEYLGRSLLQATPRLYRNDGEGQFTNVTEQVHLDRVLYGMGANYGDIDSDGYPDIYVGTGGPRFTSLIPNRLFRNQRGAEFQEVTSAANVGHLGKGHGVSFGDVDNDGDEDLFTVIGGAMPGDTYQNALFKNPGNENHWVGLKLVGDQSNAAGIGARIKIVTTTNGRQRDIHTRVSPGGSFGASSLRQLIGVGKASSIQRLEVTWPASGVRQKFEDVAVDEFYRLSENKDTLYRTRD